MPAEALPRRQRRHPGIVVAPPLLVVGFDGELHLLARDVPHVLHVEAERAVVNGSSPRANARPEPMLVKLDSISVARPPNEVFAQRAEEIDLAAGVAGQRDVNGEVRHGHRVLRDVADNLEDGAEAQRLEGGLQRAHRHEACKRRRGILAQLLPACARGVSLDVLVGGGEDQRRRARVQLVSQGRRCGAKHCAELPPSRELAGAEQNDRIRLVVCAGRAV
mmetsp:Transcript_1962/g.5506  ORF Transcript_1962/g.5506 Transcript_1962/m.5506 type:complete len:220 (+) Transcript_1962:348-1007(+)